MINFLGFLKKYNKKKLKKFNYNDVDFLNLNNWNGWANVVKIYDGDSLTVILKYKNNFNKFRIRLAEIDTAEIKSKNIKEKEHAEKALEFVKNYINNKIIFLKCKKNDKFGRTLAFIYKSDKNNEISLNELLIKEKLAYEYKGKTKKNFNKWIEDIN